MCSPEGTVGSVRCGALSAGGSARRRLLDGPSPPSCAGGALLHALHCIVWRRLYSLNEHWKERGDPDFFPPRNIGRHGVSQRRFGFLMSDCPIHPESTRKGGKFTWASRAIVRSRRIAGHPSPGSVFGTLRSDVAAGARANTPKIGHAEHRHKFTRRHFNSYFESGIAGRVDVPTEYGGSTSSWFSQ